MAEQKSSWFRSFFVIDAPPLGWRYKTIGLTSIVFGILGGLVGWRISGAAINNIPQSLGLSMLFSPYFIVPRTKTQRVWQGFIGGALAGIIAVILLFALGWSKYWPVRASIAMSYVGFLIGVLGIAWAMSMLSNWTDRRREQLDADKVKKEKQNVSPAGQAITRGRNLASGRVRKVKQVGDEPVSTRMHHNKKRKR